VKNRAKDPVSMPLEEKLWRCWFNGSGIGDTIRAIQFSYGLTLPFETVRQAFVRCCDRFPGGNNGEI
jgi:hypothetical protein